MAVMTNIYEYGNNLHKCFQQDSVYFFKFTGAASGQLMPWSVVCRASVACRPSFAFHIFDISSRHVSQIELKLSGQHCDYMEIQNC